MARQLLVHAKHVQGGGEQPRELLVEQDLPLVAWVLEIVCLDILPQLLDYLKLLHTT